MSTRHLFLQEKVLALSTFLKKKSSSCHFIFSRKRIHSSFFYSGKKKLPCSLFFRKSLRHVTSFFQRKSPHIIFCFQRKSPHIIFCIFCIKSEGLMLLKQSMFLPRSWENCAKGKACSDFIADIKKSRLQSQENSSRVYSDFIAEIKKNRVQSIFRLHIRSRDNFVKVKPILISLQKSRKPVSGVEKFLQKSKVYSDFIAKIKEGFARA